MSRHLLVCSLGFLTAASTTALADAPYRHTRATTPQQPNTAQIYIPAELHPEVAVSRELAAQPVHPWMAQIRSVTQTTYIDPLQPLDRTGTINRLDSNHSLVRAQRLHLSLTGVTNSDLAELSNASLDTQPRSYGGSNSATLSSPPLIQPSIGVVRAATINVILPSPNSVKPQRSSPNSPVPIPSVPRLDLNSKGQIVSLPG